MSNINKLTCDQIIHLINETRNIIWEDESIIHDIDFKTLHYIISRVKNTFLSIMTDENEGLYPSAGRRLKEDTRSPEPADRESP